MPGMTFRGITTPIHDKIGAILDFTQGTRDFATQLGGDFRGTVSEAGVTVNYPPHQFRQRYRLALGLAGNVAHAIHQGHMGGM